MSFECWERLSGHSVGKQSKWTVARCVDKVKFIFFWFEKLSVIKKTIVKIKFDGTN